MIAADRMIRAEKELTSWRFSCQYQRWKCNPDDFETPYLQAFRYGMPPEGGFCLGLERITMNILGLANIREATLFPRDMERVDIRLNKSNETKS
jgi:aspartyl/asparaginyl-tRNA synthetase